MKAEPAGVFANNGLWNQEALLCTKNNIQSENSPNAHMQGSLVFIKVLSALR